MKTKRMDNLFKINQLNLMRFLHSLSLVIVLAFPSLAQTSDKSDISEGNNRVQAKIWHEALVWIYKDNNDRLNKKNDIPPVDTLSIKAFEETLKIASKNNQDKYQFYNRIYKPVSSPDLSDEALIALIVSKAENGTRDTRPLKSKLENVVQHARNEEIQEDGNQPEGEMTNFPKPEAKEEPINSPNSKIYNQNGFPRSWGFTALTIAVLSLIMNGLTLVLLRGRSNKTLTAYNKPQDHPSSHKLSNSLSDIETRLHQKIGMLERKLKENELEYNQRISKLENMSKDGPVVESLPTPSEILVEPIKPDRVEFKSYKKYAHLPEEGFIKEKDIIESSDKSTYIELVFPSANAEKIKFRINPESNHKLAINNSRDRLKTFFDIQQESNEVSKIVNQKDGELIKTPQGWKIVNKAKARFE